MWDGVVFYCNVGGYLYGECLGYLDELLLKFCEVCWEVGCLSWLSF